jgi:hypothetical protein
LKDSNGSEKSKKKEKRNTAPWRFEKESKILGVKKGTEERKNTNKIL